MTQTMPETVYRRRTLPSLALACGLILCGAAVVLALVAAPAGAQTDGWGSRTPIVVAENGRFSFNPFGSLLRLFKGDDRQKSRPPKDGAKRNSSGAASSAASGGSSYSKPRFVEQAKDPEAGVLLVIGDEMADGVAEGLKFLLQDKPMVRTEKIIHPGSGLIGGKPVEWSADLRSFAELDRVRAVVVMMGQHDPASTLAGEPPVEFGTQAWADAYRTRTAQLVETVRGLRKPVIWIGLPPTNAPLLNADFQLFSTIHREEAEKGRGSYVGIWEIFLSDAGEYSSYGPDIDGQRKKLRTGDRIGFTWDGYLKVAFFVERELTRMLGGYGGLAFEGIADDPNFIVLTGRSTSSETDLLGGESSDPQDRLAATATLAERVLVRGEAMEAPTGRVDDWRR